MRLSTHTLLVTAFVTAALLVAPDALAQNDGDDLVEASVSADAVASDPLVQNRLAELSASEAYEGHSFLRLKKDLSQVKKLRLYLDPDTRAPVAKKGNPKAVKVVAERISVVVQGDDGYAWTGELRDQNRNGEFLGEVFLYVTDGGEVSGTIHVTGQVFPIESVGGGVSLVLSVDEGKRRDAGGPGGDAPTVPGVAYDGARTSPVLPPYAPSAPVLSPQEQSESQPSESSAGPFVQRLLVLYTSRVQSLDASSSIDFVRRIYYEEARTNSAYAASDIDEFDIDVVGVRVYPGFVESTSLSNDYRDLLADAGVRDLRDQYGADLVMMVVSNPNEFGIGRVNATSQDNAFSIITWSSLFASNAPGYTFAHELGHNQGAQHHPLDDVSVTPAFDYSYAHRFRDRDCFIFCSGYSYYSTILAYTDDPTDSNQYVRVPRFSSPDVRYDDQPTGVTNARDNARTLENTAARIAGLYVNRYSARISVSSSAPPSPGTYTFTASTSGAEPPSSYTWYLSSSPVYYGGVRSTSRSFSTYLGIGTWYVKLVTTSTAGTTRTAYTTVDVFTELPPDEPTPCDNTGNPTQILCPALLKAAPVELLVVSPNPMGSAGRVTIGLEDEANVTLAVYDALGREVQSLSSGTLGAGAHPFDIDAASLPPGVYVARLTVDGAVSIRRFTVVR